MKNPEDTKKPKKPGRKTDIVKANRYVNARLAGKTPIQAVFAAGFNPSNDHSAATMGSQLDKRPEIRKAIKDALDKESITPITLISRLNQLQGQDKDTRVALATIKYIFDLMGWTKEKAEETTQKLVFNIDKAVIPANLFNQPKEIKREDS